MKQFAIVGLSNFGKRMLEELSQIDVEILIVDKSRDRVELYKDKANASYITDVKNEETIKKIIPEDIDAVIIDLDDSIEASILVTNYLKKMGVKNIIVKADTDEHGEILSIVGASKVVFPNREAAKRITPLLVSSLMFNYMPISSGLVMAEIKIPKSFHGKTLIEADLRSAHGINVIAKRKEGSSDYEFFAPNYKMQPDDIFLVVGKDTDIFSFSDAMIPVERRENLMNKLRNFFTQRGST
ncbi:MAG: TrkA family potassium uptake protein [Spirochaetes bacterium]|nr:MAG: TrkA family potassium uptake protein [Spirochaetota bacterium]